VGGFALGVLAGAVGLLVLGGRLGAMVMVVGGRLAIAGGGAPLVTQDDVYEAVRGAIEQAHIEKLIAPPPIVVQGARR
jgi:hypothetical protein